MADRSTFNGASTNVPWQDTAETPEGFGNQYARHIKALYDASALPLTSVGGTGDNVTATVDPTLPPGGLRDGMKFGITWAAANSGPMTLAIAGASAAPVLSADGSVAVPGLAVLGGRALLEYIGGAFRVLSGGAGSSGAARYYWQFTASGTWAKPAGLPDDTMVTVELWGGGGGGAGGTSGGFTPGGGGGGCYARLVMRAGDLPANVPVVLGAGGLGRSGNSGLGGGETTFGTFMRAPGGGGGSRSAAGGGGLPLPGPSTGDFGGFSGGNGGHPSVYSGVGVNALFGGGGGGGYSQSTTPGSSLYGGAGGPGASGGAAGAGVAPGGGGGASGTGTGGTGARGEVRIWI